MGDPTEQVNAGQHTAPPPLRVQQPLQPGWLCTLPKQSGSVTCEGHPHSAAAQSVAWIALSPSEDLWLVC